MKTIKQKLNNQMLKVLMIGPNLKEKGGIVSVIKGYKNNGIFKKYNIEYATTHTKGNIYKKLNFYIINIIKIYFKLKTYDIVHIHTASYWSYRRIFFILLIGKLLSRKIILHIHGGGFYQYLFTSTAFDKYIIKLGFKFSNKIIFLSPERLNDFKKFIPRNKIEIIPNCIAPKLDYKKYILIRNKNPKKILYLGDLIKRKGIYDLLEAIRLLNYDHNKVVIYLCGIGDYGQINSYINKHFINKNVKILGWVEGNEKTKILQQAYLTILPSYTENFPMSILESMSYGIPVVASNIGGIPYAVENGKEGLLIPPGEPKLLANALEFIISSKDTWLKMSEESIKKIKNTFSPTNLEIKLNKIYFELYK